MKCKFILCSALCSIALYANENLDKESNQTPQITKLESVTTTANKYEQDIFDVNASVSVATAKTLQQQEVNQTQDLSKVFAGLHLISNGVNGFPTATLRGLSSPDYYSTTLNLYVDGVPQNPNFLLQAIGDVDQIELLRGPQGTLYGENSQAGLIHIKTKNPMQKPYANLSVLTSKLYEDINAYVGDSIIKDQLWFKGNIRYIHDKGFVKSPTNGKKLNSSESVLAGLGFYSKINNDLLATINYSYYNNNSHKNFYLSKTQYQNGFTLPKDEVVNNFGITYDSQGKPTPSITSTSIGSPTAIYNKSPLDKTEAHNVSLKFDYYLDNINSTLSSITAYQYSSSLSAFFPIVSLQNGRKNGYFYDNTQVIQELRLDTDYNNGAKSIIGAYYKHLIVDNGMRGFKNMDSIYFFRNDWNAAEKINTFALFGDGTIPLGDRFDLGLGARYQFYASKMDSDVPPRQQLSPIHKNKSWNSFNPRVSLGFQANHQTRLYVSAAQSTKAGGFVKWPNAIQDTIPYNPEQIYSIEVGSHTKLSDSNLQFNTALYYMYIKDRQSYVGQGIAQTLKNIGNAYSTGLDAGISYAGERISSFMGANIGLARYFKGGENKGIINIAGQQTGSPYDVSGLKLKYSPLISLVGGFDWNLANFNRHRFYFGSNARLTSSYYLDDLDHSADTKQKAFVVVDLNMRYQYKNIEMKLFTQNTTNTRYANRALSWKIGETYYIPGNPFNIGLSLAYAY